jgi:glycosyltransferase 2 family protein
VRCSGCLTFKEKDVNKKALLHIGIGLGLLVALIWWVEPEEILKLLPQLNPLLFLITVAVALLDRFIMAYKWNLLVQAKSIGLSLARTFKIYLISGFFGLFLPTGVGSDIFRIYYTTADKGGGTRIAASVFLEKTLGVVAAGAAAMIGVIIMGLFYPAHFFSAASSIAVAVFFIISAIGAWMVLQRRGLALLVLVLKRWQRKNRKLSRIVLRCHSAFVAYRRDKPLLCLFLGLSILEQMVYAVMNYWGAQALELRMELLYFLGIIPTCRILTKLPISINALGVREGLYVFFFSLVGMTMAEALALALVVRGAHWLAVLPGGILYVVDGWKTTQVAKNAQGVVRGRV